MVAPTFSTHCGPTSSAGLWLPRLHQAAAAPIPAATIWAAAGRTSWKAKGLMAERFGQQPGITQGDIGPRYVRERLKDEVYIAHHIKAGDRIRVRSTIATGVIASLTTVNLTIGGRM